MPTHPRSKIGMQRNSRTNRCFARGNVQPPKLLHRDQPSTERDSSSRQSAAPTGDGDGRLLAARRAELRQELGFVFGYANALGKAFGPASVFEIAPAHRVVLDRPCFATCTKIPSDVLCRTHPPQGLTALAPPRRGFKRHFLQHWARQCRGADPSKVGFCRW